MYFLTEIVLISCLLDIKKHTQIKKVTAQKHVLLLFYVIILNSLLRAGDYTATF